MNTFTLMTNEEKEQMERMIRESGKRDYQEYLTFWKPLKEKMRQRELLTEGDNTAPISETK